MKHNHKIRRVISASLFLLALTFGVSSSRAAVDYYLQIDGIKGEAMSFHKTIHCTLGKCELGQLPSGDYKLQFVDKAGKAISGKHPGYVEVSSLQMEATNPSVAKTPSTATGSAPAPANMAVKGQGASTATQIDPNSGATSGKRMHKSIVIRKTMDMASPLAFTIPPPSGSSDRPVEEVTFSFQN